MPEESISRNTNQEILKDILVGRDFNLRNLEQQSIENQLNVILNISNSSNYIELQDAISKAYLSTVPNGWFDWRPKATNLSEILAQLQEMPYQNLLEFVAHLIRDSRVSKANREKLSTLTSLKINRQCTYAKLLHSYLLIQLRPEGIGQPLVKAWFIPDDTIQDPWERFKPLKVDEQQVEIPYILDQMPTLLSNLLQQCFEEHLRGEPTELTVEVFLPRERLYEQVEKWEYKDSEDLSITIGSEYSVVVRSYERFKKLRTAQGSIWRKNWLKVQELRKAILCDEEVMMIEKTCYEPSKLRRNLVEKLVLKVCCTLSESDMDGLLKAIHSAGTPIVLLSRCDVVRLKNGTEFHKLLEDGPLQELSIRLKKQRLAAENDGDQMHFGNHLVLLWDDPNRVPPNPALEFSA
jgi:vWA-MoxR associated protein C-terminal domain/vWA-MoxR associated protein middle region (VMAP-M) 1